MWRWRRVVLCSVLSALFLPAVAWCDSTPRPPSTILIDALTGQVLAEHDADTVKPAESLTQLMVVLLALEEARLGALPLDAAITISEMAAKQFPAAGRGASNSMRIPLRADKVYVLNDLLKAVLVSSAHDAAVAAAEAIAGSVPACLELMNARAQKLSMQATRYASIGGTTAEARGAGDVTTARDAARLAQALVHHPQVLQWASLSGLPFDGGSILLRNVNQLVGAISGVDGLQASADHVAGNRGVSVTTFSTVATAQRGALRLIAVVLGASSSAARYTAAAELLEWGFTRYERVEVVREGEPLDAPVRVLKGSVSQLTPIAGKTFSLLRQRGEERDLELRYQLPTVLTAPLTRHQQIGEVIVEEKGQLIAVVPVLSPKNVQESGVLSAALP